MKFSTPSIPVIGNTMTDFQSQSRRRRVLKYGVAGAALISPIAQHSALAQQSVIPAGGCCLRHGGDALISQSRLGGSASGAPAAGSGDASFDRSLGVLLADLAGKFKVRPGFGYYDDSGSPNALALSASRLPASEGTVLFGRELLSRYLKVSNGDMFIMGICAHEFAHVVQFFSGVYERLDRGQRTKKLVELHADFLSGYYIGLRKISYTARELVALGRSWESLGDSSYTDPQHHGTSEERLRAVERGYLFARERPEFGITAACEVGARYLNV